MSDAGVRASIDAMEAWLSDPAWVPDPESLADWNAGFQAALSEAERGEGWEGLVARAHATARQLEQRTAVLVSVRDGLKAELEQQERGARALKGYGATMA